VKSQRIYNSPLTNSYTHTSERIKKALQPRANWGRLRWIFAQWVGVEEVESHRNLPQLNATHYNALQLTFELWARGKEVAEEVELEKAEEDEAEEGEEDEAEEKMQWQLASAKKLLASVLETTPRR